MKTRLKRNSDRRSLQADTLSNRRSLRADALKKTIKTNRAKPSLPMGVSFAFLVVISLFAITLLSYQIAYLGKIYPGVKVAGVNLGNKTPEEAKLLLEDKLANLKKGGLAFSLNSEVKDYSLTDLGVSYNLDSVINQAYQIGRKPNLVVSFAQKVKAWKGHYNLNPQPVINESRLQAVFDYFSQKITNKPIGAKIHFLGGTIQIDPPVSGEQLDTILARTKVNDSLATFSISPILLDIRTINPTVTKEEIEKYQQNLEALLSNPIKLTFANKTIELGGEKLANLISFKEAESSLFLNFELGGNRYLIKKVTVNVAAPKVPSLQTISLDQELLSNFVSNIAQDIDQDPQNGRFNFADGKVTLFTPSHDGQKLDENDTLSKINNLFEEEQKNKATSNLISLKVAITKATVTTDSVNNLGIKELIGQGLSTFYHSIPNRASNIALAATRVNGTLVAPGQVFSMYKTVGEVDSSTGYKEAYIISQGKTQLDFGGGVCQVSTTLFRAALNSGLPILERHPHAYRVGYYEQNSPAGIDASVFFPNVDFQFRNDTQNYILIQTVFDGANASLTFNFYGTRDGRQVSMTRPVVSNQIPPPPDLNQDDPTLPLGVVKQVDFSAWGATASFSRTVTRGGETLASDTFYSKYQPWQAIFLHGTKVG